MDVNDFRTLITVVSFAVFVGILAWAWSGRRRESFEEAANLPFADSDIPPRPEAVEALRAQPANTRGRS